MAFQKNTNNKDVLLLEILEKDGVVAEYQRTLYEASLFGIENVMFMCVWEEDENSKRERGTDIFPKILKTCEILNIEPYSSVAGYYENLFNGAMVGKLDENGNLVSMLNLEPFGVYKKNRHNKANDREKLGKILAKHISELI